MANRLRDETNSRVYKMSMKEKKLYCSYCRPHRSENAESYTYKRKKKQFQLTSRQRYWL